MSSGIDTVFRLQHINRRACAGGVLRRNPGGLKGDLIIKTKFRLRNVFGQNAPAGVSVDTQRARTACVSWRPLPEMPQGDGS
jgi:hypothetical protein